jgi:hypothetical protein
MRQSTQRLYPTRDRLGMGHVAWAIRPRRMETENTNAHVSAFSFRIRYLLLAPLTASHRQKTRTLQSALGRTAGGTSCHSATRMKTYSTSPLMSFDTRGTYSPIASHFRNRIDTHGKAAGIGR